MRKLVPLVAVAAVTTAALAAPPAITISGRLVNGSACPPATLVIEGTPVGIASATPINPLLIGTPVRVTGAYSDAPCMSVLASSIVTNPFQLSICPNTRPGCEMSLDMCPSPTSGSFIVFGSLGTAVVPVTPSIGTFLLDPSTLFVFASGNKTAVCEALRFFLPSNAAIIGATVHFQAAASPPGGAILSNRVTLTVNPPGAPCTYFECF